MHGRQRPARRRAHRGPAQRGRPDPGDQEEADRGGPGGQDLPDRAVRVWARSSPPRSSATSATCPASPAGIISPPTTAPRPPRCPRAAARCAGLSRRGNRRLNHAIHMTAVTQIRCRHSPGRAYYEPRLLRQEAGRGQDWQRGAALPQAADQRRDLRLPPGRCPARRSRRGEEPGRATGEPLQIQGGRLAPRAPALRASHSRACHPPYGPRCCLSRAAALPRERAARSRTGRSPAAQRRPRASSTRPDASR